MHPVQWVILCGFLIYKLFCLTVTVVSLCVCVCVLCSYFLLLSSAAVQIGFQQDSYTILEKDESVRVCVQMSTGNYTVPVTLAVLYTGSAQSMSH